MLRSVSIVLLTAAITAGLPASARGAVIAGSVTPHVQAGASMVAWSMAGMELGRWEAYLARELTPEFELLEPVDVPEISWLLIDRDIVLPDFARVLVGAEAKPAVSLFTTSLTRSIHSTLGSRAGQDWSANGRFQRSLVLSGISRELSTGNRLSVSAVLA
ncbi:MAG: hypothetical protein R3323_09530, partial [Wenzhouxiangellaceae bacterium]|nr:hypothetical protein [Wenzhouxiangellaceae bacterium]